MPDDPAERVAWLEAKRGLAEQTVVKHLKLVDQVAGRVEAIEKQKLVVDNDLLRNVVKQAESLKTQEAFMRDLPNHAATFYKPQLEAFLKLHQSARDNAVELRMGQALLAEVLKDLHHASVDLARAEAFAAIGKSQPSSVAHDPMTVGDAVATAAGVRDDAFEAVKSAIANVNAATREETQKVLAAEASCEAYQEKLAELRKADPVTDQRLTELEDRRRSQLEKVDWELGKAREWQSKLDVALKAKAEKAVRLPGAVEELERNANWGERAYHMGKGFYNSHSFEGFAGALRQAGSAVEAHLAETKGVVDALSHLNEAKQWLDGELAKLNAIDRLMELAKHGDALSLRLAQEAVATAKAAVERHDATLAVTLTRVDALQVERDAADAEFRKAEDWRRNVERHGPDRAGSMSDIAQARAAANEAYATFFKVDKALHQAKIDATELHRATARIELQAALKEAEGNLETARHWAEQGERRAHEETPEARQARTALAESWESWRESVGDRQAALQARLSAAQAALDTVAAAQSAMRAYEATYDVALDLQIRGETGSTDAPSPWQPDLPAEEVAAKAKAALEAFLQQQVVEGGKEAAAKKATLDEFRSGEKLSAPSKGESLLKDPDEPKRSQAEIDAELQRKALDDLREALTTGSLKMQAALGRDLGQDIVRQLAERTNTVQKSSHEMVAGDLYRVTALNGMVKVDLLAQASIATQAEAYYNNLGAFGSAAVGFKSEAGAAVSGKTDMGNGTAAFGNAKAYAVGAIDTSMTGSASLLGAAGDILAKAYGRGELKGMTGFELGEQVTLASGGQASAETEAAAKFGAKLGVDGGSFKLSGAAEAAVRAGYIQNAQLGALTYGNNLEVWAKARAEATAKAELGMVDGELKFSHKVGAEAGAGVGVQETKKVTLLGLELEAGLGVHAGTLGATADIGFGYKNGKLKWNVDVGAALGVGISLKLSGSIDFVEVLKNATQVLAEIVRPISSQVAHNLTVDMMRIMANNGAQVFT
jgi:hypothetical protein